MKPPAIERTSAAKAGWVIVIVLLAWVFFFLFPFPRPTPDARPKIEASPPSALVQAGLRDYRDWDGLPQFFALWVERAEWRDDRTCFAFWHPVTKDYSYHFEARRVGSTYTFREIAPPSPSAYVLGEVLAEDCPLRFYYSVASPGETLGAPGERSPPPGAMGRDPIPAAVVELPVPEPPATRVEPQR